MASSEKVHCVFMLIRIRVVFDITTTNRIGSFNPLFTVVSLALYSWLILDTGCAFQFLYCFLGSCSTSFTVQPGEGTEILVKLSFPLLVGRKTDFSPLNTRFTVS